MTYRQLQAGLVRFEVLFAGVMLWIVLSLILLNVVTRSLGVPVYWVDELAVYAMIWMVFSALPVLVHRRANISVTLLQGALGNRIERFLPVVVDLILVGILAVFLGYSYRWFSPHVLAAVGFDYGAFADQTFNFIYQEPTNTLAVRKFVFWSIMLYSMGLSLLHAVENLLASLSAIRLPEQEA